MMIMMLGLVCCVFACCASVGYAWYSGLLCQYFPDMTFLCTGSTAPVDPAAAALDPAAAAAAPASGPSPSSSKPSSSKPGCGEGRVYDDGKKTCKPRSQGSGSAPTYKPPRKPSPAELKPGKWRLKLGPDRYLGWNGSTGGAGTHESYKWMEPKTKIDDSDLTVQFRFLQHGSNVPGEYIFKNL